VRFFAGKGAKKVITVWISALGIAATALVSALAGLTTPRLLPLAFVFGAATVAAAFWYPPRYVGRFRVSFDGRAVKVVSGVFVKKELFLPADAIRAFEVCSTPAQRLFGCRTIAIRFAGGAAFLPLLSKEQAEQLAAALEELEE
jgi:membrane protein YdbS with pleckstrin-like domain